MADGESRPDESNMAADNQGLLTSDVVRTGYIDGATFRDKLVRYHEVDGLPVFEGDIILPRNLRPALGAAAEAGPVARGVVITGEQYRWPNAVVPYVIDSGLPNQDRVIDAIAHIEQNTIVRFVQRTAANAAQYPNFVRVFRGDGCWSYVGMQGNQQDLSLANACSTGSCIHEWLHALGCWHEQSREDRDAFVTINTDNIVDGKEDNFDQHISDGDDAGPYDYGSIMHYGTHAFSKNGLPTITPKQSGVTIGQRNGLSDGDIAALHGIYRGLHHNLTVSMVFATPQSKNAWASLSGAGIGAGWRKIDPNARDGVTNTLCSLATAKVKGKQVHAQIDGTYIYQVYA
jgi:hypothetical protein